MSSAPRFDVRKEKESGVYVVQLTHLTNSLQISRFLEDFIHFLEREQPRKVVVNFDGMTRCSSEVISGLLRVKQRIVAGGGELKLCCMSEVIREAYRLLNLDGTVFEIYDTCDDAIWSLTWKDDA